MSVLTAQYASFRPTLDWLPAMPTEVRTALAPLVERHIALVPTWCHVLLLDWDDTDRDALAKTTCRREYRWAKITVCPSWLRQDSTEREDTIVHELLHVVMEPVHNHTTDMLNLIREKYPDVHAWAEEQRRYANEATVQDMTRAIRAMRSEAMTAEEQAVCAAIPLARMMGGNGNGASHARSAL